MLDGTLTGNGHAAGHTSRSDTRPIAERRGDPMVFALETEPR